MKVETERSIVEKIVEMMKVDNDHKIERSFVVRLFADADGVNNTLKIKTSEYVVKRIFAKYEGIFWAKQLQLKSHDTIVYKSLGKKPKDKHFTKEKFTRKKKEDKKIQTTLQLKPKHLKWLREQPDYMARVVEDLIEKAMNDEKHRD